MAELSLDARSSTFTEDALTKGAFARSGSVPLAFEPRTELGELDMDELDDVNGGLFPALVGAAYIGLVGYAIYKYASR